MDASTDASQRIVDVCERFARAQGYAGVRLADLGRIAFASERRVRQAFVEIRGMPPTERLRRMALDDVRTLLAAPGSHDISVTTVAARHGFQHLGRFAADYRQRFGEHPSETLRAGR